MMPIFQLVWILRSKKNPEMFTFISRGCFVCRFHVQNQIFAFYKLLATQKATMLFSRFYSFVNFDVTIQGSFIQKSFGTNVTLFRFCKGRLILKANFRIFIWTKNRTIYFWISALGSMSGQINEIEYFIMIKALN